MPNKKSFCCGANLLKGGQCENCGADGRKKPSYRNCYLIYNEDGCLVCRTNHRIGTPCLMDIKEI